MGSALGKFVEFCGASVDSGAQLQRWLQYLPITGDLEEAKEVYKRLCSFLEQNGEAVLGANNANLGHIVNVFAEALETRAVDDELTARIKAIVTALNQQFGAQLAQIVGSL